MWDSSDDISLSLRELFMQLWISNIKISFRYVYAYSVQIVSRVHPLQQATMLRIILDYRCVHIIMRSALYSNVRVAQYSYTRLKNWEMQCESRSNHYTTTAHHYSCNTILFEIECMTWWHDDMYPVDLYQASRHSFPGNLLEVSKYWCSRTASSNK